MATWWTRVPRRSIGRITFNPHPAGGPPPADVLVDIPAFRARGVDIADANPGSLTWTAWRAWTARSARSTRKTWSAWLVAGVSAALLGTLLGYREYHASVTAHTDERRAIQLTATQGVVLLQTVQSYWRLGTVTDPLALQPEALAAYKGVKPATPLHRLPRPLPNGPALWTQVQLPDREVQAWKRHAQALIDDLYAPNSPAFAMISQVLDRSIDETRDGTLITLDAGVQSVTWSHTARNGDAATVSGRADFWAAMAQWQEGRGYVIAAPHNIMLLTMTLRRTDGAWKIADIQMDFAPGSEP
ncbi:MAG: hypothetical protein IMW98_01320 [Firmicutes bacterium]|nr:hypothetical protein [Bacillota bacterium]